MRLGVCANRCYLLFIIKVDPNVILGVKIVKVHLHLPPIDLDHSCLQKQFRERVFYVKSIVQMYLLSWLPLS